MLYAYVEQNPSVSVTYMISGVTASVEKVRKQGTWHHGEDIMSLFSLPIGVSSSFSER